MNRPKLRSVDSMTDEERAALASVARKARPKAKDRAVIESVKTHKRLEALRERDWRI